jgi:hypothetical protein
MYSYVGSDVHHDNHIAAFEQKVNWKICCQRGDSQQSVFKIE